MNQDEKYNVAEEQKGYGQESLPGTSEPKNIADLRAVFMKSARAAEEAKRLGDEKGLKLAQARMNAILNKEVKTPKELEAKSKAFAKALRSETVDRTDLKGVSQRNESRYNIKERVLMKTIKELNKELKGKAWYRLLSVLWIVFYIVFLLLLIGSRKTKDFRDAILIFCVFTITFLGATAFFKRAIYYAVYYIITGNVFLKELNKKEGFYLLFIVLWGILSIIFLFSILKEFGVFGEYPIDPKRL